MQNLSLAVVVSFLTSLMAIAEPPSDDTAPSIEAWLEETVNEAMAEYNVPGVVVGLVIPGQPPILRGFGLADVEAALPMDPLRTVLPVASVSKVYTAAVILEMAAAGRLDLDADVSTLVPGLTFAGDFDAPITLRHLLTHTAGLDEQNLSRYAPLEEADASVRDYLIDSMPARIRAPGIVYQYSNHGMALAGVAAEIAGGVPFPELMDQLVFGPLGMSDSSLHHNARRDAVGYVETDGALIPQSPHYVRTAYSGMLVSTAADQVRMLQALLDRDQLAPGTIDGLLTRQFSHDPVSLGSAFAMFEDRWAGTPYFWHEGQTRGFYSGFYLVPDQGIGLFVACNRHHSALARTLRFGLLRREIGEQTRETDLVSTGPLTKSQLDRVEGTYRYVRHAHGTPELIVSSMIGRAGEIEVAATDDGLLRINRSQFAAAGDLLFVEPETGAVNGFLAGPDGTADYLYYQRSVFERIPFYADEQVRDGWFGLSLVLYAATLLTWTVLAVLRRGADRSRDARTRVRWLQLPGIVIQLVFIAGVMLVVGRFRGDGVFNLLLPWPTWMHAVFFLPWIALLLMPLQLIATTIAWRAAAVGRLERLHHGLLLVFALWFVANAWIWKLL